MEPLESHYDTGRLPSLPLPEAGLGRQHRAWRRLVFASFSCLHQAVSALTLQTEVTELVILMPEGVR